MKPGEFILVMSGALAANAITLTFLLIWAKVQFPFLFEG